MSMKNSNDPIGNRTRDLPTCSAVPQPTAPPHVPCVYIYIFSVLDFEVEINMYNKCHHEVAIFTAWWELCLSYFNHGETDSKTEVKWYWWGKLNYLEKNLSYFIHLPPALYVILAIYIAVKWNSSFHHFGYTY